MKRMKACEKYRQQLPDFVRRMLSPEEGKELIRHLADCSICQPVLKEMETAFQVLKQENEPELPQSFWSNLTENIGTEIEKQQRKITVFKPAWVLAPAAAVAALFLVMNLFQIDRQNLARKNTLPEGSLVWLEAQPGEQNFDQVINQTLADMNQEVEKAFWEEEDIVTLLAELSDQEFETLEKKVKNEKF